MVGLLGGILLLGAGMLAVLARSVLGRVRRGRSAAAALRAMLRDGSARLREGWRVTTMWRRDRFGSGLSGPGG